MGNPWMKNDHLLLCFNLYRSEASFLFNWSKHVQHKKFLINIYYCSVKLLILAFLHPCFVHMFLLLWRRCARWQLPTFALRGTTDRRSIQGQGGGIWTRDFRIYKSSALTTWLWRLPQEITIYTDIPASESFSMALNTASTAPIRILSCAADNKWWSRDVLNGNFNADEWSWDMRSVDSSRSLSNRWQVNLAPGSASWFSTPNDTVIIISYQNN